VRRARSSASAWPRRLQALLPDLAGRTTTRNWSNAIAIIISAVIRTSLCSRGRDWHQGLAREGIPVGGGHRQEPSGAESGAGQSSGLGPWFAATRTADQTHSKPHPAMVLELIEELGADPQRTLVIGDTSHDLLMAASAGVASLGVTYGAHEAGRPAAARTARADEQFSRGPRMAQGERLICSAEDYAGAGQGACASNCSMGRPEATGVRRAFRRRSRMPSSTSAATFRWNSTGRRGNSSMTPGYT
jgi:hypothetical protein